MKLLTKYLEKMERRINLLYVTQYLEIGGLETLIVELCKNVNRSKFNVQVLCLNGFDQAYKNELSKQGIPVTLIKKSHRLDFLFLYRIVSFLKREKIELLHAHGGCFLYSAICGKIGRVKKFIYTAHGLPVDNSLQARLEDYTSALMTDKIIAVSQQIKEDLRRRLPISTEKLDIIINGINTAVFKPNGNHKEIGESKRQLNIPWGKKIIGSVGRLEKIKNYRMLIQSFAELIENQGEIAHLAFVGDGSERDNLENYSRELGISDRISFLGMQYHIEKILPILDIFALSSLSEGTSISLLEAQSCGIPVVVTDVGGNGNIVKHGYNGLLCKVNDYKDMAEKLTAVLKDENLRNEMKNHARSVVLERFDLSSMVRAYETLYENLILN